MVSGKWIVGPFLLFLIVFLGGFYYVAKNSKGREHNRNEQKRELEKMVCIGNMKDYIDDCKIKSKPVLLEKLNEFCESYEFYYFPENYLDMRKILIVSSEESMIQLKSFKGELSPKSTSMGYFVMYGGEFRVRDVETKKIKALLLLEFNRSEVDTKDFRKEFPFVPAGEFGTKIDPNILANANNKIFLLKKKSEKPLDKKLIESE